MIAHATDEDKSYRLTLHCVTQAIAAYPQESVAIYDALDQAVVFVNAPDMLTRAIEATYTLPCCQRRRPRCQHVWAQALALHALVEAGAPLTTYGRLLP